MPTISRENVEIQFKNVVKEIRDAVLKIYSAMDESLYSELKNIKTFKKIAQSAGYGTNMPFHLAIEATLKSLVENEEKFIDFINESTKAVIIKEVMDHRGLNILMYVIAVRKVVHFAREFATATAAMERQRIGYKISGIEKMAIDYIHNKENVQEFGIFFKAVSMDMKDMLSSLEYLRGLQVSGELSEAQMGLKRGSTDPGSYNFLPYRLNPAYYFGLVMNKLIGYQYDTAVIEAERFAAVVQSLEMEKEGATDRETKAQKAKAIDWYNKRIAINITKIKRIEDDANS